MTYNLFIELAFQLFNIVGHILDFLVQRLVLKLVHLNTIQRQWQFRQGALKGAHRLLEFFYLQP